MDYANVTTNKSNPSILASSEPRPSGRVSSSFSRGWLCLTLGVALVSWGLVGCAHRTKNTADSTSPPAPRLTTVGKKLEIWGISQQHIKAILSLQSVTDKLAEYGISPEDIKIVLNTPIPAKEIKIPVIEAVPAGSAVYARVDDSPKFKDLHRKALKVYDAAKKLKAKAKQQAAEIRRLEDELDAHRKGCP